MVTLRLDKALNNNECRSFFDYTLEEALRDCTGNSLTGNAEADETVQTETFEVGNGIEDRKNKQEYRMPRLGSK